ncbi:acyl-CoA thioesterase [Mycobacterium sp.]|uniref:acyl-CoA thioesterase n=1 Tax=Mycobacterium sp. TaxID=1785 RepID=UPI003A886FC8
MTEPRPSSHPFDEALRLNRPDPADPGRLRGRTRPEWANMVGPFGGITAATLLRAVEGHPDRIGEPLALTVNYTAPIADGEFDIAVRAARTNRTNQHWIIEQTQDGSVTATATAVLAIRRDTWSDIEATIPEVPGPDDTPAGGLGDFIAWARQYDMRFVQGPVPGEGARPADSSTTTLWMRHQVRRRLDFAALAAMCDVFYPRIFLRRGAVVRAGTVSLTSYFHADQAQLEAVGDDYVLGSARANAFGRGHSDQSARLWSRDGALLAATHQVVHFKD